MQNFKIKNIIPIIAITCLLSSCEDSIDKVNDPIPYPNLGGYLNADEVSKETLLAKWNFENNTTDTKNNITGMDTNVEFTQGVKGMAWKGSGDKPVYSIFSGEDAVGSGLQNGFTLSFWINSAGTVDPATPGQGKGAQGIFSLVNPTGFWGGLNIFLENPDSAHPDRLRLKIDIENKRTGVNWGSQGLILNVDGKLNVWNHIVFTYNASNSTLSAYVNGNLGTSLSAPYAPASGFSPSSVVLYADDPGGPAGSNGNPNNAPKYGTLQFTTDGTVLNKILIGSHQFETNPPLNNGGQQDWATSYAGLLDEFRIFGSALSASDVYSLYNLEKPN